MEKIKNISIPSDVVIEFVFINSQKFVIFKNSKNIVKYFPIPAHIKVSKIGNFLSVTCVSEEDGKWYIFFNLFLERLKTELEKLNKVFKKKLILKGLGYRITLSENRKIELKLGFSHLVNLSIPENLRVKARKNIMNVEGTDKVLLGNFVDKIVSLKSPDSYKGKGFWFKYQKKTLKIIKKK